MELKDYLSRPYEDYTSFLDNVIYPVFGEENFIDNFDDSLLQRKPDLDRLASQTGIKKIVRIGTIDIPRNPIDIFDITVSDSVQMARNRVSIKTLVNRIMDSFSGAFMIFHYENRPNWHWRFSFCNKRKDEVTDSKRFTFLLGPGQSCRTAADNFMKIAKLEGNIHIENIVEAFNVESLSKEFFDNYREQYANIIEYVTGKRMVKVNNKWEEKVIHEPNEEIMQEFSRFPNPEKAIRDYVKKLMGRLVFLQFLQKKGWLGVPANAEWGTGDAEFIQNLFANTKDKDHFIDNVLEALFNDLNSEDEKKLPQYRTPYLNGGLFERDASDETNFPLPAKYMQQMLDFFSSYNFTIDENDPDDAEVGVDPEMLGRIFENLLEDNKDKGAFYTPKEIVTYMCRESLIAYLQTDVEDEPTKDAIRQFVITHEKTALGTNNKLHQQIDEALKDVKICDPAIGSGAFPMGLLKELFLCRTALEGIEQNKAAEIKKHIIQQNIYGVDIERGAVDIARLRFWLSLIVDEETPQALPNLDFKIMQGNSLLEQYKGIDLSTMTEKKADETGMLSIFDDMLDFYRKQLREMLNTYYNCTNYNEKKKLRSSIIDNVKQQLKEQSINVDFGNIDLSGNDQFMLWHTWFYDVFSQGGFDIVIGNPPYVEAKKLKHVASILKPLFEVYSGTADLSIYFIEHGKNLLAENGILSYITTNKFFNTGYGKLLRKLIISNKINKIINFEQVEVFEGVLISSVILEIRKSESTNEDFTYDRFYKLNSTQFKKQFIARIGAFGSYPSSELDENEWSFSDVSSLKVKRQIEKGCKLLGEIEGVNIYRGITTGYNPAFIINNEKRDQLIAEDPKNASVIKNMLQGRNIRKWYYNESDENLVFVPWHFPLHKDESISGASKIAEERLSVEYKALYNHLLCHKEELADRNHDETGIRYEWYALQRCAASYYEEFEKPEKIIWGLTADKWAYALDTEGHYLPSNGYILTSTRIPIKYILGLLNSALLQYYFSFIGVMTAGGAYTLKAATISALPFVDTDNYEGIISIVDRILSAKKLDPQADTSALEAEIDRLVYQLYDLTEDEIRIVEGKE